jgi:potassium channel subfamily K
VIAATLYFTGATLLLFNELGHVLGHYPATFNLTPTQRRIMLLNVLCITHLAVGGAIFQKLIGISYANAVYFSLVTILTIGFGDIVPNSTLGRALDIPYVYIGVILFGFTVASISVSVLEQHSETVYFYRLERSRLRALRKTAKAARGTDSELTDKHSFEIIKEIHHCESKRASIARSILGLASFAGFWLIGALVFSCLEGWTYFDSIYFTTFCFVTTGYGDFAPQSNGGRPFFIVWAIAAVPMMTIFISSVAEAVSARLAQSGDKITHWAYLIYDYVWSFFPRPKHSSREIIEEIDIDETPVDTDAELNIHKFADLVKKINIQSRIDRIIVLLKGVESFTETLIKEPDTMYTYEDWQLLHKIIQQTNPKTNIDDPVYWLSDRSPLRFPIVEPRFFLLSTLSALESEVKALGESENSKALSLLEDDSNGSQPGVDGNCDNENNDADESDSGQASSSPSSQISHSRPPSNPLVKFISPKFDRS